MTLLMRTSSVPLTSFKVFPFRFSYPRGPSEKLCKSIKESGILTPLLAVNSDSGPLVLDGHRRLFAARVLKRPQIPVAFLSNVTPEDLPRIWLRTQRVFRTLNPFEMALFIKNGSPVISIDTKKKEQVGNYKNSGKSLCKTKIPKEVEVYDFAINKAVPYGVYNIDKNEGFVNVGMNHDTSEFAVESIRRWWNSMGKLKYETNKSLLITADGGGSNGSRRRLWKTELQRFANETGLSMTVCHFPPGTSKWNKIEHRLFSHITMNWQGKPLESYEAIVNLIGATKTRKGLKVEAVLDKNLYEKGIKVSDEQLHGVNLFRHAFHGEWNYTIRPIEHKM